MIRSDGPLVDSDELELLEDVLYKLKYSIQNERNLECKITYGTAVGSTMKYADCDEGIDE